MLNEELEKQILALKELLRIDQANTSKTKKKLSKSQKSVLESIISNNELLLRSLEEIR